MCSKVDCDSTYSCRAQLMWLYSTKRCKAVLQWSCRAQINTVASQHLSQSTQIAPMNLNYDFNTGEPGQYEIHDQARGTHLNESVSLLSAEGLNDRSTDGKAMNFNKQLVE